MNKSILSMIWNNKYFLVLGIFSITFGVLMATTLSVLNYNVFASDSCECNGKITSLTLKYLGSANDASIEVVQSKNGETIYTGTVSPEETFTFTGTIDGTTGNEVALYVNGELNVAIHTSCSQPIAIGMVFGDFEIVDGYSLNNGQLCTGGGGGDCECSGVITGFTLKYLGSTDALIKVVQHKNGETIYLDTVSPLGTFTFTGTIDGTVGKELGIYIDGQLDVAIHTSCSQPIAIGMIFGQFEIIDGYSKNNGQLCIAPPSYSCGYPFTSSNPLTSLQFEKNEVIRAVNLVPGEEIAPGTSLKVWYGADKSLVLGVDKVDVKTSSGTTTTNFPLAPLPVVPGGVLNPDLGTTQMSGDFSGLDPEGKPEWPVLYITDTTANPNSKAGDWQYGGTPISPDAVFGTWKGALRLVDNTKNPPEVKVRPGADPVKNHWDLDGGDPAPSGLDDVYFGSELRWDYSSLGLLPGHSYRFQVIAHYGYSNDNGGKSAQACVNNVLVPSMESDLAIDITDVPAATVSSVGADMEYRITVTNNGPNDATGALVLVDVPDILKNPSWTCIPSAGSSCTASQTGDINDTVNIKTGGTLIYTLLAKIDPATNETVLTVPAEVVLAGDPDLSNNSDSDTNTLEKEYDIIVVKDSPNNQFIPGAPITYVLTISNDGPSDVTGGTVTDNFPSKLSGATWTCVATPSVGSACSASGTGNIADTVDVVVGGNVQYTVHATINPDATGNLLNKVIFDSNDGLVREDDHEVILTPKTDLAVTITNGVTELIPGEQVTYTIIVSNNGPSAVMGGLVSDNLPGVLTNATWSCVPAPGSVCGDLTGTGNINTTVDLPVNGSVTYTLTATVDPGAAGVLTNSVTVAVPPGYIDTNLSNNTDSDSDPLKVVTDVTVTKTDNKTLATPGMVNTYTIVVSNVGPNDVNGEFSDPLPPELINASWTCVASSINSSCTASGTGDIVDNAVVLKSGESVTYTLTATIDPSAQGDIVNKATIVIPGTVPLLSYSDSDITSLVPEADLAIEIEDVPFATTSVIGSNVLYQVTVTNNGPSDAMGAVVTVDAPAILLNTDWICTPSAGSSCTASQTGDIHDTVNLLSGGTLIYLLSATIDPATTETILTVPAVVAFVGDTNPANNMDSDTNTLTKDYDITVTKNSTNTTFVPGAPITYVLTVTNAGPTALVGGTVKDDFPSKLINPTWTCVATPSVDTSCSPSGSGNINDTVDIEVGGQVQYTVVATIKPDATGSLFNKVIFDSNDGIVKEDDHDVVLTPKADLAVTITDGVTDVSPGDTVTYTIVMRNNGPSNVLGGTITDILPVILENATWSCAAAPGSVCGDLNGNGDINSTADLPVNGSVTYTLTATVAPGAAGVLTNSVSVDVPPGYIDTNYVNNTASDTDTILAVTDVIVEKTDNKTQAVPGTVNTYTIVVTNVGTVDIAGEFSDPLPAELINATWTCAASSVDSSCTASGAGDIVDNAVFLKPGEFVTYTLTGTIDPSAQNEIINTATITVPGTVPLLTYSATDTTSLLPETDLAIVIITQDKGNIVPGGPITYLITATNNGPSEVNQALVKDTMPPELVPGSVNWACVPSVGSTCSPSGTGDISDLVNLPVGGSLVYTVTATVDPGVTGPIENIVTIEPPVSVIESDYSNNTSSTIDSTLINVDVAISITDTPDPVLVGSGITYTTQVLNMGPLTANGTEVKIDLPPGVTFSSVNTNLGTCSGTTQVVCDLGDLGKDVPVTITIQAVGNSAGVHTATANVTTTSIDVNPANNSSTTNTTVNPGGGGCTVNCGGGGGGKPTPKPKPAPPEEEPEQYCLLYTETRDLRFTDMGNFEQVFQDITNSLKGTFMVQKGYKDLDQYVLSGYGSYSNDIGEKEVKLDLNLNRLQWAKILMTSHCLRIFEATKLPPVTFFGNDLLEFSDLPLERGKGADADWFVDVMYSAKYYEIIDGTYEATADTLREVTFAEAVKMLIRAGEAAGVTPFDLFSRLTEANPWYLMYYSRAVTEGILVRPFGLKIDLEANVFLPRKYAFALLLRAAIIRGLYSSSDVDIIMSQF